MTGDVPAGRETKEGGRGQRPRRRLWWWALAWPHRRGSCHLRPLSSLRVVGHPSWYIIIVVRAPCHLRALSCASIIVRVRCCSRLLSSAVIAVHGSLWYMVCCSIEW